SVTPVPVAKSVSPQSPYRDRDPQLLTSPCGLPSRVRTWTPPPPRCASRRRETPPPYFKPSRSLAFLVSLLFAPHTFPPLPAFFHAPQGYGSHPYKLLSQRCLALGQRTYPAVVSQLHFVLLYSL